jgi:hypothetical protein
MVTLFTISGFKMTLVKTNWNGYKLRMADELNEAAPEVEEPAESSDPRMFDMNRRVRLGRSRDQDGKSNIWSIEPTMEVVETEEPGLNSNLKIAGLVIGAALVSLPLFSLFSTLFPDPSDF